MFIFAGLIGMFPKHLPKKKKKVVEYEIDGEKCNQKVETADKYPPKHKDGELKGKHLIKRKIPMKMFNDEFFALSFKMETFQRHLCDCLQINC